MNCENSCNNKSENPIINTVPSENQMQGNDKTFCESKEADFRVLFVGNSITRHAPKPEIGWMDDWGMAASGAEKDYVHQFMNKIRTNYPNASFMTIQFAEWERNFWKKDILMQFSPDIREFCPTLVILNLGENVRVEDIDKYPFDEAFKTLVLMLKESSPQIISGTCFWTSEKNDNVIRSVSKELNIPCVELGDLGSNKEMMALGKFEHEGVAAHPGDKGMQEIAERFYKHVKLFILHN